MSINVGEIVATTLRNRAGKLADNVTDNNVLLARLKERGKVRPVSGGRTIVEELEYAENTAFKWYSGYETLDLTPSDVLDFAEFNFKQCAAPIMMSGLEMLQNAGKEQVIDLMEARIRNAEKTMLNQIGEGVYADGTGSGGKEIGGLQLLVSDTGEGTIGGINAATYTFWKNYVYDFSAKSISPSATTIQAAMNDVYLSTMRGRDQVDLIVGDNVYFNYYWTSLQSIQRITNEKMGAAGFQNLKFMGADVVPDGGKGGNCPASHMYFINSDYLSFRPHRERNMVALSPDRYATNQDAVVQIIAWAGNMTVSNRSLQGLILA